ncbi:MAG: hypothetical protein ACRD3W_18240, partial [Terriglobales bacterium]
MDDVSVVPPRNFPDQRGGLIAAGVLLIILGALISLAIPLVFLSHFLAEHMHTPGTEMGPIGLLIPGVVTYLYISVALIWLGIGLCQCRRWARALLLVSGWIWLIVGTVAMVIVVLIVPGMMAIQRPGVPSIS